MPHGGHASAKKHAEAFFNRQAEKRELTRAMQPANPHASGHRLVAHGAGRLGLISEWARREEVDHPRVLAAMGTLRCRVCGQPMTVADYDASHEARHPDCPIRPARPVPAAAKRLARVVSDLLRAVPAEPPTEPEIVVTADPQTGTAIALVAGRRVPLRRDDGTFICALHPYWDIEVDDAVARMRQHMVDAAQRRARGQARQRDLATERTTRYGFGRPQ